jgi:transmembrane sensor
MRKNLKHIINEDIIVRIINGDSTDSEKEYLETCMNEDPGIRKTVDELKKIWDHSESIKSFQSNDTNVDWLKIKKRINFESRSYFAPAFLKIAAVVIILLGIGLLVKQFIFRPTEINLVRTGDFKNEITLPDGSRVFLNKYSELKYPVKFQRNLRQVDLKGEGYFDVVHNPNKLFRIKVNSQAIVEVLGTSFDLKSDSTDSSVAINVTEGKVAFFTPEIEPNKTVLTKGEKAVLRRGVISVAESKDVNFMSWKTGILNFNDERIENVFRELTKFYNKDFRLKNIGDKDIRLTSTFDNQELESVLKEIKLVLNLEYTVNADTITFYFR